MSLRAELLLIGPVVIAILSSVAGSSAFAADAPKGWGAAAAGPVVMLKAEEVKKLEGKMVRATAPDNEKVLDTTGQRAKVEFVWVEDEACEKGTESQHKATFELKVPKSGTYYPWARVWWANSCGQSIWVHLEREGEKKSSLVMDATYKTWHWLPMAGDQGMELKEGVYTVTVQNRQDGAKLSRILFATKDYETYKPETLRADADRA